MKSSIKFLAILLIILSFQSCNDNDNNNDDNNNPPTSFEGTWRLLNVTGGIAGTSDDFEDGSISWTFNNDGTVDVINMNTDDTKVDLIETGNYTYEFVPNTVTPQTCEESLEIDGVNYGCHSISESTMTISQVESDGYLITLEKIEFATTKK